MFSAASQLPTHECSLLEYVHTVSIFQSLQSLTVPELYGVVDVSAADFVPWPFWERGKKREQIELVWVAEGLLSFQMWDIIQHPPNYCHFHNPFSCNPSGSVNECKSQTGEVRCSKLLETWLAARQQCEGGCRSKRAEWKDRKKNHKHLRSEGRGGLP